MRKRIGMTTPLIALALTASFASCQNGRSGGSARSSAVVTDPNTVFAQGGAHENSATGSTNGSSSRRRRGMTSGNDANTQSQQQ
jgi:hypothetical protein